MKRCPECGRDNADDVLECRFCMADLPDAQQETTGQAVMDTGGQTWKITVLEGEQPGQTFIVDHSQIHIGRADPVQLWHPEIELTKQEQAGSHYVSRKHAQINIRENRVYIMDLGSMHGTVIEGRGKAGLQEFELFRGDKIRIGKNVVVLIDDK